jgi:flagellar hook protein FlgE
MSLFTSLLSGVSGMTAQSRAMSNISNNISNTNTVGYKSVDTSFSALVTNSNAHTSQSAGVISKPVYNNALQGTVSQTDASTNIAVTGNGMLAVQSVNTSTGGTTTLDDNTVYTRRGDFSMNKDGYLVNGAGYGLMGYAVNSSTQAPDTSQLVPIRVSQLIDKPVATTRMTYSANLPANAVSSTVDPAVTPFPPSSINIYDSLGQEHKVEMAWAKKGAGTVADPTYWELKVNVPGGKTTDPTPVNIDGVAKVFFNNSGANAGSLKDIQLAPTSKGLAVPTPASNAPATITLNVDFGSGPQAVAIDLGKFDRMEGTTQFADTDIQINASDQNGIPRGSYQSVNIDSTGNVILNYDNGQSKNFFQVPLAKFNAPEALQRDNGEIFRRTPESGTPLFTTAGSGSSGEITGSALEQSNVDIAAEFSKMIITQRAYSANTKSVTTADQMLQELLGIK